MSLKISEVDRNSASRNERRAYKGLLRGTNIKTCLHVAYVDGTIGLTGIMCSKP